MWRQIIVGGLLLIHVVMGSAAWAQDEHPRLSGVLENYFWAYPQANGVQTNPTLSWLHLEGDIRPGIRFAAGLLAFGKRNLLDENYLELEKGNGRWRIGRFRSAFGHSDWADLYYSGFVRMPLMRSPRSPFGLPLSRMDTGIDFNGGSGALQYQLGWIDVAPSPYTLLPTRPDHLIGRVQTYRGSLILGANALVDAGRLGDTGTRLFDLDWRWSAPQVQMRGEWLTGRARGHHADGYYMDLFYHPIGLHRTTFLARVEGVGASGGDRAWAQLYTIGIKQIVSPLLTLELTHAWGSPIEPAEYARGWAVQAITFLHF